MNRKKPDYKRVLAELTLVAILFAGAVAYQKYATAAPDIDYAGVAP